MSLLFEGVAPLTLLAESPRMTYIMIIEHVVPIYQTARIGLLVRCIFHTIIFCPLYEYEQFNDTTNFERSIPRILTAKAFLPFNTYAVYNCSKDWISGVLLSAIDL